VTNSAVEAAVPLVASVMPLLFTFMIDKYFVYMRISSLTVNDVLFSDNLQPVMQAGFTIICGLLLIAARKNYWILFEFNRVYAHCCCYIQPHNGDFLLSS